MNTKKWLKDLRKTDGMSQAEISQKLGISGSYYSMIENGDRQKKMSLELAQKISELFSVPLDYILQKEMEG